MAGSDDTLVSPPCGHRAVASPTRRPGHRRSAQRTGRPGSDPTTDGDDPGSTIMAFDLRGSDPPDLPTAPIRRTGAAAAVRPASVVFVGVEIETGADALVPRAETELLAEVARTCLAAIERPRPLVVDMCCGAGNLACVLALSRDDAEVHACDLTAATVALAARNARRLDLADRLAVHRGDLFAALGGLDLERRIDLVVCNPPYLSSGRLDGAAAALLEHEPREAFDGGPYGLSVHQRLIREAPLFLRPGGRLAFEFGEGQHRQIERLLRRAEGWDEIRLIDDPTGVPRVAVASLADPARAATTPESAR
jgi:HemK-like putative methylase